VPLPLCRPNTSCFLPVKTGLARHDADTLALWREAVTAEKHVHRADTDIVSISDGHGNSKSYTLDRLKREAPAPRPLLRKEDDGKANEPRA
jgi:hypothetical protein